MCYHINGEIPTDEAPELTPPDRVPVAMQTTFERRPLACRCNILGVSHLLSLDLIEHCLVMIMCLNHNIGMVTSELKPLLFNRSPT
jgi:hypothetical protein